MSTFPRLRRPLRFLSSLLSSSELKALKTCLQLGVDYVHANELEFKNGKLTGEVMGEIVDGNRKAELLQVL